MARDQRTQPSWLGNSTERVEQLGDELEADLKAIAVRLAKHEGSERVLEKHVEQAFQSLACSGLERRKIWQRPESEVGLGALLVGLAPSVPDVVGTAIENIDKAWPYNIGGIAILVGTGVTLVLHGWWRNYLR